MPSYSVTIQDGPLAEHTAPPPSIGSGAVIVFEGIVRPDEDDRAISGLDYTTYDPMAQRVLESLAEEAVTRFGLEMVHVQHSRGFVPAGECSFRLIMASAHRREALDAMDDFIDRMKQDAPIWKQPQHSPAATPCPSEPAR